MDENINDNYIDRSPKGMRLVFGIFMIAIYLGMGALVLIDFFQFEWQWMRYVMATVFIVYGIWRAVRLFDPGFKATRRFFGDKGSNAAVIAACVASLAMFSSCGNRPKPQNTSTSGLISIVCDESFQNIINQEIEVFEYTYPKANIIPIYADEHAAIDSLISLKTQFIVTAHQLKPEQVEYVRQERGTCFTQKIAVDAIALIVNPKNPIEILSMSEIGEILSGKVTRWDELSPSKLDSILVVFDHQGSSTARYMKDSLLAGADFAKNVYAAGSTPEVYEAVAKRKGAIGIIGVSWVSSDMKAKTMSIEERVANLKENDVTQTEFDSNIKVLKVRRDDSVEAFKPYQAYIYDGSYPLYRPIYAICAGVMGSLPHGFFSFVTGFNGQKIIQQTGVLPATIQPRMVNLN